MSELWTASAYQSFKTPLDAGIEFNILDPNVEITKDNLHMGISVLIRDFNSW